MKWLFIGLALLVIVLVIRITIMLQNNANYASITNSTLNNKGQLIPCPDSPNCINTEYPQQTSHYLLAPSYSPAQVERILPVSKEIIHEMGGKDICEKNNYLSATFSSTLFGFVDDFEIRRDDPSLQLHIRSASRIGYSDFGVNKQRVEIFITKFKQRISVK